MNTLINKFICYILMPIYVIFYCVSCEFNAETLVDGDEYDVYEQDGYTDIGETTRFFFERDQASDFEYTRRGDGMAYVASYYDLPLGEDYGDFNEYSSTMDFCFTFDGNIAAVANHYNSDSYEIENEANVIRSQIYNSGYEYHVDRTVRFTSTHKQELVIFDTDTYSFTPFFVDATDEVDTTGLPEVMSYMGMTICTVANMPDGGYVAIVREPTVTPEDAIVNETLQKTLRLVRWDNTGTRIFTKPVYQYSELIDGVYKNKMYTSKTGTIYIVYSDQFIAISPEGEYMYTFVYPEEIASMNNSSHYVVIQYNTDGDLIFCYPEQLNDMTGGFRYRCFYIDDEAEGLGREYEFPDIGSFCPYFGEGYDVFLHGFNGFYGYNEGDKYPTLLFTYLDIDVDYMMLLDFKIISADRFAVLINNPIEGTFKYGVVEAVPEETVAKREILTLAYESVIDGESNTGTLLRNIRNFNVTNSEYRIEVVEYNSDDSMSANDKLLRDIISGEQIDIVVFANSITPEPFVSQDAFLDLYEFMDSDDSYTRDKFLPCVLEPIETADGELPYLAVDFALSTLVGSRSNLEDYSGSDDCSVWGFDDIARLAGSLSGDEKLMKLEDNGGDDKLALLDSLLPNTLSSFVDYDGRSCDFGGDDFKSLIEVCSSPVLRESYEINPARYIDEVMLKPSVYTSLRDFMDDRYLDFTPDDIAYIGYPTNDTAATEGTLILPVTGIALTKNCASPDGAWEFIKSYIESTTAYIEAFADTPMSVYTFRYFGCAWETVDALIELVRDAEMFVTTVISTDNTGSEYARRSYDPWFVSDPNDRSFDENRAKKLERDGVVAYVFGDEDEAALRRLLSGVTQTVVEDAAVEAIVVDEVSAYFGGVGTLDDAARQTDGRVRTYLAE